MNTIFKFAKRLSFVHPIGKANNCFSPLKCLSVSSAEDYVTLYKFPYIIPLSMINQMKHYHTVLTAAALPFSSLLYGLNIFDGDTVKLVASIGR